jgi:hypothetical protein
VNNVWTTTSGTPWNLTCAWHIVMCSGSATWYTLQACNLWSTTVWTTSTSYGNYFQWGNNYASTSAWPTTSTLADATGYWPWNYYSSTSFILWSDSYRFDWTTVQNDNLWWNTTDTPVARQWPCANGYHVPSQPEWSGIVSAWWWGTNGTNMQTSLKMPFTGRRFRSGGTFLNGDYFGRYWSSSPISAYGYQLYLDSSNINASGDDFRANGFSVRCFKN